MVYGLGLILISIDNIYGLLRLKLRLSLRLSFYINDVQG
jgi:hypothetical protein